MFFSCFPVDVHVYLRMWQLLFDWKLCAWPNSSVHVFHINVFAGNDFGSIMGILHWFNNANQSKEKSMNEILIFVKYFSLCENNLDFKSRMKRIILVFINKMILSFFFLQIAVFIGPILAVLFSVFGFCTRYVDINKMFQWMWHFSYFRAGFHGVLDTVYGMNRSSLNCPPTSEFTYCHFRDPKVFLREVSISEFETYSNIYLMVGVIFTMHILTVLTLWFKLNKR